ncbi:MAG: hypothetical protein KKA65_02780 [Nanoarchaeota archaeon]|nr:hypothetical protein [Nanoarchaeota archaeon]MBU4241916.1 hypothetical protein [Nanoarchaeota archaeon]MBU4352256.1 hypothetical protein [Nanoarchaeota archaeon]MBU4456402.1 hypothetical protein [Nanoarchaeota archaeon]MCG2720199.1 hypothetical protein [Nanoarchaeota archaeon]
MKRGEISTEKLIGLVLLLAFLMIAAGIIYIVYGEVDATKMGQFSCWMSNGLKSGSGPLGKLIPSTCSMTIVEEKAGLEDITKMLTNTWWMYHQGDIDLGSTASEVAVFQFIVKDEISFENLVQRLVKFKGETQVTDLKDSDFNYLQEGSEGPTLCVGLPIIKEDYKLKKDQIYFIMFFESNRILEFLNVKDVGDKVIISSTPNLDQEENYYCPSYANLKEGISIYKTVLSGTPIKVIGAKKIE